MSINRLLQGFVALLVLCHTNTFASEFADKLQTGHYVLLMRHAYAPGVGDPRDTPSINATRNAYSTTKAFNKPHALGIGYARKG